MSDVKRAMKSVFGFLLIFFILSIAALSGTSSTNLFSSASRPSPDSTSTCGILVVPSQYPTIQGAINAAKSCDTIQVLSGTYIEQLVINKSLTIVGNSSSNTIIQAPSTLNKDFFGATYIVEVANHAKVTMADFNVTGPGPGTCDSLTNGIEVLGGATLSLSSSVVTHIRDNPLASGYNCTSGFAISVGPTTLANIPTVGHAIITGVTISDYQADAIAVGSQGTTATIVGDTIVGDGYSEPNGTQFGVYVYYNASSIVEYDTISNNQCTYKATGEQCGLPIYGAYQDAGVYVIDDASKNLIEYNSVFNNYAGIFLGDFCCQVLPSRTTIAYNTITNSTEYGIELQDINTTGSHNLLIGGQIGVGLAAGFVNSTAILVKNTFVDQATAEWQAQSYNGYTAKIEIKK
jgi:hypothetical protein